LRASIRTYGGEVAVESKKLEHVTRKGASAFWSISDIIRTGMFAQICGDTGGVAGDFPAELPGSEGKTAIRTVLKGLMTSDRIYGPTRVCKSSRVDGSENPTACIYPAYMTPIKFLKAALAR
jgi:hypothetical protein